LIITSADGWVVAVEFAGIFEGNFLPEAWEVKHAEWACGSGADEWDDLGHGIYSGLCFCLEITNRLAVNEIVD